MQFFHFFFPPRITRNLIGNSLGSPMRSCGTIIAAGSPRPNSLCRCDKARLVVSSNPWARAKEIEASVAWRVLGDRAAMGRLRSRLRTTADADGWMPAESLLAELAEIANRSRTSASNARKSVSCGKPTDRAVASSGDVTLEASHCAVSSSRLLATDAYPRNPRLRCRIVCGNHQRNFFFSHSEQGRCAETLTAWATHHLDDLRGLDVAG